MINFTNIDDERFLNAVDRLGRRMSRVQTEVSSGKRLHAASDDPDSVDELLSLRAGLSKLAQIKQNLNHFKTETDTAEKALSDSVKVLERARVLATQGATGTMTAEARASIAVEVRNLTLQLSGLANSAVNGRYLFGGDADTVEPFPYNPGPPATVGPYAGSAPTREALGPAGQTFPVARAGDTIFASADASRNAFAALAALTDALEANDEDAIRAAYEHIGVAGDHMNQQLAFYGAVQNNVAAAQKTTEDLTIQFETQRVATEETDLATALVELNQLKLHQDSIFSAKAQFPKQSLFDYLR